MIELDKDGNLPMVGPEFRIALRAQRDTSWGGHSWFLGVINKSNVAPTIEEATKREEKNEYFVAWLTPWFDITSADWQTAAGLKAEKPEGVCVEFGLKTESWPDRHRGEYLQQTSEKFHGLINRNTRPPSQKEEATHGVWFVSVPENISRSVIKRHTDTLTQQEQLGSPGQLAYGTILDWYKTSRPGGQDQDVESLQRKVAVLIEHIMDTKNGGCQQLQKLSAKELKKIRGS